MGATRQPAGGESGSSEPAIDAQDTDADARSRDEAAGRRQARFSPLAWAIPAVLCLLLLAGTIDDGAEPGLLQLATAGSAQAGGDTGDDAALGDGQPLIGERSSEAGERQQVSHAGPGPAPVEGALAPAVDRGPTPMARRGPVTLYVPAAEAVLVGFHEAGTTDGLELEPVGQLISNRNTTRVTAPDDDPAGAPYIIMHSRGRAAAATSAVDVVMVDDDPVLSPVTGTVSDVRQFLLGGQYTDLRVEIIPDADPDRRVVVIHLADLQVAAGDRVVAAETALAGTARRFPFFSQIDQDTDPDRWPHVHIEIKESSAPRPGG